tara:strand:- start:2038 stop:3366 length:1329 start_codon:yes stop_codon:yes gene_type:complete
MDNNFFQAKELDILRNAIDNANILSGKKLTQSEEVKNIILILEQFLRTNKILCYGGTAVNNILPEQHRFYNRNIEIPDYDFFSPNALELAKKLANIYYNKGYNEVEAKAGVHSGTFKVYVNFLPIADITFLDKTLFSNLYKKAIKINSICYCPPNFLRMAMYLELSRPMGDITRWEKVLKRLILLNKNYPIKGIACDKLEFQRFYNGNEDKEKIYDISRKSFIDQGLIFFGGYAGILYGNYMPKKERNIINKIPDFDILSEDAKISSVILKEQLEYEGIKNIKIIKHPKLNEYIPEHFEIKVNRDSIAFIYNTFSCHSYNIIYINNEKIKIASIDTILSLYLAFIYSNKPYYNDNRLLCICELLFKVQLKNRLKQKGLLKRFSINCYGKHEGLEEIRANKSKTYKKLKDNKNMKSSKEYQYNFLRYIPSENNTKTLKKKSFE